MKPFVMPPLTLGLDNVSPEGRLPKGAARRAVNVVLDLAGGFAARPGFAEHAAIAGLDNLWQSPAQTRVLGSIGNEVHTIDLATGASAALFSGVGAVVSYEDVGPDIYVASPGILRKVGADGVVRRPGVADLAGTAPTLSESVGGLDPGRYGVAYSLVNDLGEESPISAIAWIELTSRAGILVSSIQTAPDVAKVRLYLTAAGGDELYTHDTRAWATSTTIMLGDRKRRATRMHRQPMPGGNIVRYGEDGRLYVVDRNWVWISDPQDYGVSHLESGWLTLKRTINVFEPVRAGNFVVLRERTYFMRRDGAKWVLEPRGMRGAFEQSGMRVPADFFDPELAGGGDERVAVWLSEVGVAIGRADGSIVYPQVNRVRITGGAAKPSFVQTDGIKQLVFCVEDLGPGPGVAVDQTI